MHHVLCTLTLALGLLLTGCIDLAYWNAKAFYGIDCRPEKLQHGTVSL